jgi:23S rRNA (guanosine2251-2'-O)-methyltransferase
MAQGGLISGRNAVLEALRSGETINRVLLAEGQGGPSINEVIKRCRESGIPYQFLPKARLIKIAGADHRGVVCELSPFRYAEVEDMLQAAQHKGEPPLLVLLDGVEDPHNLGAVMRTALCAGAHGIIIPKRRSASFTATVSKTSAGASAYMPLARVSNLTQTARLLQQAGLWLAAADMDGQTAWQADLNGPLALVLGGEGEGVSQLLKRQCDMCISLPMSGPVASLNVSAAASALLYEIRRQRAGE